MFTEKSCQMCPDKWISTVINEKKYNKFLKIFDQLNYSSLKFVLIMYVVRKLKESKQ